MLEDFVDSGSFARSFMAGTVHMTFGKAAKQLGLPELARTTFMNEIIPYLQNAKYPSSWEKDLLAKLWNAVGKGEVIATDVWQDAPVFYVRAGYKATGLVVRLIFQHNAWHVESLISLYERTMRQALWFRRSVAVLALLIAVGVGFALHQQAGAPNPSEVSAAAPAPTVVHPSKVSATKTTKSVTPSVHSATKALISATANLTKPHAKIVHQPSPAKVQPKSYAFHLALGMPLFNLAQFLFAHHLVANAMGFDMTMKNTGIDQAVQPGTYVFREGMSVKQLLQVLKRGPSSS